MGLHHVMIARVWAEHGLRPHRLERYMAPDDPDLRPKRADIIGLYLNPPTHAAVFCVDEKTAIQALDRLEFRSFRSRPDALNGMASSTSDTAR